jgi:hypothetical protein
MWLLTLAQAYSPGRLELRDPHVSIGKVRHDVKLPAHRFDVAAKRADVMSVRFSIFDTSPCDVSSNSASVV